MARRFQDIQQSMLDAKAQALELNALEVLTTSEVGINDVNSTSKVSIWRLMFWIVSFAIWVLEELMDAFTIETEARIAATRPHTKGWYREKALAFLFGIPLIPDTDRYDLTGYTDEQISAAKIITNAAAVKTIISGAGALRIKAATTVDGNLAPLEADQLEALSEYFNDFVADAGTNVLCTTGEPDDLKLKLKVFYDPLVLAADGSRLDGTNATPVQSAINNYLKGIKFNGSLVLTYLEQELKSVGGVVVPVVQQAWSKHSAYGYDDVAPGIGLIDEIRVADAGYMKLDETVLEITFLAYPD